MAGATISLASARAAPAKLAFKKSLPRCAWDDRCVAGEPTAG
jgi:hypothetical protein